MPKRRILAVSGDWFIRIEQCCEHCRRDYAKYSTIHEIPLERGQSRCTNCHRKSSHPGIASGKRFWCTLAVTCQCCKKKDRDGFGELLVLNDEESAAYCWYCPSDHLYHCSHCGSAKIVEGEQPMMLECKHCKHTMTRRIDVSIPATSE